VPQDVTRGSACAGGRPWDASASARAGA